MTSKAIVEDFLGVNVHRLARMGYLRPGEPRRIGWRVDGEFTGWLTVEATDNLVTFLGDAGDLDRVAEDVKLTRTEVGFGERRWFVCPGCDRRCAVLYVKSRALTCRECVDATYLTSTLGKQARLQDRLHKARAALGMDECGHAVKPRGMHEVTWLRLWQRYWEADEAIVRSLRTA